MTDPPPEIPDLEIIAEMGRGTTGVVYQARCMSLDRIVALKTRAKGGDELDRRRFERAAMILARLTSRLQTGIPKLYTVGEWQGQPYITREYIEGATLESIAVRGEIDLRSGVRVLQRVAETVAQVHTLGVIHRNLQPSNVLIATDKRVWLIGFGHCKMADPDSVQPAASTAEADVRALQQMLNWLCATLSPDLPSWIRTIRQSGDLASAQEFAAVLCECLGDSNNPDR